MWRQHIEDVTRPFNFAAHLADAQPRRDGGAGRRGTAESPPGPMGDVAQIPLPPHGHRLSRGTEGPIHLSVNFCCLKSPVFFLRGVTVTSNYHTNEVADG